MKHRFASKQAQDNHPLNWMVDSRHMSCSELVQGGKGLQRPPGFTLAIKGRPPEETACVRDSIIFSNYCKHSYMGKDQSAAQIHSILVG